MGRKKIPLVKLTPEMIEQLKEQLLPLWKEEIINELDDRQTRKIKEALEVLYDYPLTVHQVSALTGRSEQSIYKMCQRGAIPFTKYGKQVHINIRDICSVLILARDKEQHCK